MLLNSYWVWHHVRLFYLYHYTDVLFGFMIPDWALALYVFLGLIGIYLGIRILKNTLTIKKGLIINLSIFTLSILIETIRHL